MTPEAAGHARRSAAAARPTVEVYYSAEDPLKRRSSRTRSRSTLAEANAAISAEVLKESAQVPRRDRHAAGRWRCRSSADVDILGLRNARAIIEAALAGLPKDAPERVALEQVSRFARLAADNLDLSKPILASISKPVQVKQIVVSGSNSSLERVRGRGRGGRLDDVRRAAAGGRACWRSSARRTRSAGSCAG